MPTGYGQQTALFAPRIRDLGHDLAISAYAGIAGAMQAWEGIAVYPADEYAGNKLLDKYAEHFAADLVVTLMDVWVMSGRTMADLPMACWVPVDHWPCPPAVARFFTESDARPIAMSRFGERQLADAGLDPLYVPHGVDTGVFKPCEGDRGDFRRALGLPADVFLVGMFAANIGNVPPRKAFPQALDAFARFHKTHPDSLLYLHTEMTGRKNGIDLAAVCEAVGLPPSSVGWPPILPFELGMPQQQIAALYQACDVTLLPSYGEGFGIPLVESQACGTPVITGGWTAMEELCGAGWQVEGDRWWDSPQKAFYGFPHVDSIVACLEDAYGKAGSMRDRAREFALQYDADRVAEEHWRPVLDRLLAGKNLLPKLNRAQRRTLAKR